jgi:hypothetical protein
MESSMKMMSWSRYHCLSGSTLRAARRCRVAKSRKRRLQKTKLQKIWPRSHVRHPRPATSGAESALTRYFQFVIRLFRT